MSDVLRYESTLDVQQFDRIITLKWIQCGQPRAYTNSIYEAELTFTGANSSTKPETTPPMVGGCHPPEETVKAIARILVCNWTEEDKRHSLSPYLSFCRKLDESPGIGRWHVRVVVPFCD